MSEGNESQCVPAYRLLSAAQIERLHAASLKLLETVGVKVLLAEAVDLLADAGCRVRADSVVQIPPHLVEACIHSAPSQITVYNRLGRAALQLADRRVHFGLGTDLLNTYDLETGRLRTSRLSDVANAARIAGALENIDFIASYALPQEVPANLMYIDSFRGQLENAVKPIFFTAAGAEDLAVIHAMAAAVVGGAAALRAKPIFIHYAEPLSPLAHSAGALRKLFFCADHGIPVTYTPGMMSGATAPTTLAGAVAMGNAEALSGIVLHQLRAEGAPIISGFGMATFDMKTCACVYGCPEYRLAISACADLYHHYGIPMWGTAGASDALAPDHQAAAEWTASLLTAGLDGANLIHDVAYLGQGTIGHPAGIVICDEIISYVKRVLRGFSIDDAHLDLDVIGRVGPMGNFITAKQTLQYFRTEHWQPQLFSRLTPDKRFNGAAHTLMDRAVARAAAIVKEPNPFPLSDLQGQSLDRLRAEAAAALADAIIES
jgi:trimethylamine--corrinoid protein Co-methyltransferase